MPTARFLSCCCIAGLAFAVTVATTARGSAFDDTLESEGLGIFLAAIKASGITVEVKHGWTILASTDAAFAARINASLGMSPAELLKPANRDTLKQVMWYHIIPSGSFPTSELENCQQLPTQLKDAPPLTAQLTHHKAKLFATSAERKQEVHSWKFEGASNSARVMKPDIEAGNSMVHIVDDVLLPRGVGKGAVLQYYPSFESVLTGAKLTTMMAMFQASGIVLSPEQRYTILAPTDAAFASRLRKSLGLQPGDLLSPANAERLHKILSYHILTRGNLLTSNLKDGQQVRTSLQGAAPLAVQRSCNSITFQGPGGKAHVTAADVRAGRDIVVHVVDDVLLPAA